MYVKRLVEDYIEPAMVDNRAVVIYGPRRSGKTTLCKKLLHRYSEDEIASYSCDAPNQAAIFVPEVKKLQAIAADKRALFIDEAQNIENAGLVIKLLVDHCPGVKVVVTGSSSFELSDKIKESMVGRAHSFTLLPFSISELANDHKSRMEFDLSKTMQQGLYPEVYLANPLLVKGILESIVEGSLYRDLIRNVQINDQAVLPRLLTALSLQVGSEVSYNELASLLEVSRTTIERYIYLLEKAFVIFRLDPLSANPRKLLASRKRKVYFYDLGVRAAFANQVDIKPTDNPQLGGIFENLCILERFKNIVNNPTAPTMHYWRSPSSEVDYIETSGSFTKAYEIKWSKLAKSPPKKFINQFPDAIFTSINNQNLWDLVTG